VQPVNTSLTTGAGAGVVAAMAMTGVRVFFIRAGVVKEDPPARLSRKQAHGLLKRVPRRRRGAVVELVHWVVGAVLGVGFALLPPGIQRRLWAGPLYGLGVWMGFDAVVAPALGLSQGDWPKGRERAVFVVDHLLYGVILSSRAAPGRDATRTDQPAHR
jgi:uncharacterized membrane protein YagU involved in acid resistance